MSFVKYSSESDFEEANQFTMLNWRLYNSSGPFVLGYFCEKILVNYGFGRSDDDEFQVLLDGDGSQRKNIFQGHWLLLTKLFQIA